MYKNFFSFICFFSTLWMTGAFAGGANSAAHLRDAWGATNNTHASMRHMFTDDDACIGPSSKKVEVTEDGEKKEHECMARQVVGPYSKTQCSADDEKVYHMMIAMQINENGAYFCPIQMDARNIDTRRKSWTEYRKMGKESDCVWLCKPGHYGRACKDTTVTLCDATELKRENYIDADGVTDKKWETVDTPNIEDSIPMFWWNMSDDKQETDIVLAITGWLDSGRGAYVRPVGVRALREGCHNKIFKGHQLSWIEVYEAVGSAEELLCKNGYKAENNECVEVDPDMCLKNQACSEWTGFDKSQHTWVQDKNSGESCYEYRCSADGYAFESATNRTCVPCPTQLRQGENSDDGRCERCTGTDVFTGDKCGTAKVFTKSDMQYGYKKTRNTQDLKLESQCWTKLNPEDYKKCVLEGVSQ